MKRLFFLIISMIFALNISAQTYKFAWISDLHLGYTGADENLNSAIQMINSVDSLKFLLVTGDIAEKGRNSELESAKEILDQVNIPYYIIPGNHDTKWSESAGTKFIELWESDKFFFEINNDIFIGINSGIPWKGGGGHIKPEDLRWLEDKLSSIGNKKEVYFVSHHPLTDIDNWFKVTNLLRKKNLKAALNGHGHDNKISIFQNIPTAMTRSTLAKNNDSWGLTIVENRDSLIKFYEVEKDSIFKKWGDINKLKPFTISPVDSSEFISYKAEIELNLNLETTLLAPPIYYNDYIYSADINGIITCFDTSGSVVWDYDAFGNIYSQPAIVENYFIVGTAQGDLITLDAQTGEQIQSIGFDEGITSQLITYDYTGSKSLIFAKNSDSKACVVLGTSSGKMYCYDVETLQEYWVFDKPNGMIETKPIHIENKIIFGCWDSKVYCIDDRNGLLIWEWNDIKNFYYSPAACWPVEDGKKAYFASPNKNIYAIDIALGITSWKKDDFEAWESIGISNDNKLLFIKGIENKFHVVSAKTTNRMKLVKMKYGMDTMPGVILDYKDMAVFNGENGDIYSVDRKYNHSPLLFMGTSRALSVQQVSTDLLLASNMDGRITLFSIK